MFSLHAQGWPWTDFRPTRVLYVLPARAGMARTEILDKVPSVSSPCTRRDGPYIAACIRARVTFSLHAQGWPEESTTIGGSFGVLPARAGMARMNWNAAGSHLSSPCTRRDGPPTFRVRLYGDKFSLHAQGWPISLNNIHWAVLVLPARAGMARTLLPALSSK